MAKVFDAIGEPLREWIGKQRMFFVATAPLSAEGHVNLSPKGPIETLHVLDPHAVAYLDMVGSGAETIAHLGENGRIVIMLCSFEGPPRIVRLHGRGTVVTADSPEFSSLFERCAFDGFDGVPEARRAIVHVEVTRIADSCGYGVPLMSYEGERPHSRAWAEKRLRAGGEDALTAYQREKNSVSIDGLPAINFEESAV
ncbi:MAG: pyridoxamine 5'-phosphate oxidase family protein [Solirubrobacteraceae bacterium]